MEALAKARLKAIAIGVDPDVEKSGFAYFNREGRALELRTYRFLELYEVFRDLERKEDTVVYVEAGWLNRPSNFRRTGTVAAREKMAKSVGRNEQVGRMIIDVLQAFEIDYIAVQPKRSKTSPAMFEKLTGYRERNQEKIDAAMLVIDGKINDVY